MPNDVGIRAVRWIPFDSVTFDCQRADLSIHLQIVVGLDEVAQVRGVDDVIPGRVGRFIRNRVKDKRDVELYGLVQAVDTELTEVDRRASYREMVDELQAAFDPTIFGTLEVDREDGTTIALESTWPLAPFIWSPEEVPCVRLVSIALESVAPDWTLVGS